MQASLLESCQTYLTFTTRVGLVQGLRFRALSRQFKVERGDILAQQS